MAKDPESPSSNLVASQKLNQAMDSLQNILNPPGASVANLVQKAIEPLCLNEIYGVDAFYFSSMTAHIRELIAANNHWQQLMQQTKPQIDLVKNIGSVHQSWHQQIESIQNQTSSLLKVHSSALQSMSNIAMSLTSPEHTISGVNYKSLAAHFHVDMPLVYGLKNSISTATSSYLNLASSIQETSDLICMPKYALPGATREIFSAESALQLFESSDSEDFEKSVQDIQILNDFDNEALDVIALLDDVAAGLSSAYIGAREALNGSSKDKARHILISLRELFNNLLNILAPDRHVNDWISNSNHDRPSELYQNGRITRKARLLYICKDIRNSRLSIFLIKDTNAFVAFFDFFNRVHDLEHDFSDAELKIILMRADSWLLYILKVSR